MAAITSKISPIENLKSPENRPYVLIHIGNTLFLYQSQKEFELQDRIFNRTKKTRMAP